MANIFVSYRRDDTRHIAGRICDRLKGYFGDDEVFVDVENIPLGVDFRQCVQERLETCQVMVAIIGDNWLVDGEGPSKNTRIELAAALGREDVRVIPVLTGDAPVPSEEQLPDDIKALAFRNGFQLHPDRGFEAGMQSLIEAIENVIGQGPKVAPRKSAPKHDTEEESPAMPPRNSSVKPFLLGVGAVMILLVILMTLPFSDDEAQTSGPEGKATVAQQEVPATGIQGQGQNISEPVMEEGKELVAQGYDSGLDLDACDSFPTYFKAETLFEYDAAINQRFASGCPDIKYTVEIPRSESDPEGRLWRMILMDFKTIKGRHCRLWADPDIDYAAIEIACQIDIGEWETFADCPYDEGSTQEESQAIYDECLKAKL